jgi:hypothetical protein
MQIVHVQTDVFSSEHDSEFIKVIVMMIQGVRDVASVPSIGLTSVLCDERRANITDIVEAVCSAGFAVHSWSCGKRLLPLPATVG